MYYFLGIKYLGICKYYTLSLKILNTTKPEVHILEIYSLVYILGGSEKWKTPPPNFSGALLPPRHFLYLFVRFITFKDIIDYHLSYTLSQYS